MALFGKIRQYVGKNKDFNGEKFWVRGHAVSTAGFVLEKVKKYIAQQEKRERATLPTCRTGRKARHTSSIPQFLPNTALAP